MLNFQKFYFWYNNNLPLTVTDDMSVLETLYKLTNEFNRVLQEVETQFNSLEATVHETFQQWENRFETFTTDLWNKFEEYKTKIDTEIDRFETEMTNSFNELEEREAAFEERINNQYIDLTNQWTQVKADWESYKASMNEWKENVNTEWANYRNALNQWQNQLGTDWLNFQKSLNDWKNSVDTDIQNSITNMNELYSEVNSGWENIKNEFSSMKAEWNAFQNTVNTTIEGFQNELNDALGRITANEADIKILENSVSGVNNSLNSVSERVTLTESEIAILKNSVSGVNNSLNSVSERVTLTESEIAILENSVSGVNNSLNSVSERVTLTESEIAILKNSVSGDNKALSTLIDIVGDRPDHITGTVWQEIDLTKGRLDEYDEYLSETNNTINNVFTNLKLYKTSDIPELNELHDIIESKQISGFYLYVTGSYPTELPGEPNNYTQALYKGYFDDGGRVLETLEYFNEVNHTSALLVKVNNESWSNINLGGNAFDNRTVVNHLKFNIEPSPTETTAFFNFAVNKINGVLCYSNPNNMIYIYDWPENADLPNYIYFSQTYNNSNNKYLQLLYCFYSNDTPIKVFGREIKSMQSNASWTEYSLTNAEKTTINVRVLSNKNQIYTENGINSIYIFENLNAKDNSLLVLSGNIKCSNDNASSEYTIPVSIYALDTQLFSDELIIPNNISNSITNFNITIPSNLLPKAGLRVQLNVLKQTAVEIKMLRANIINPIYAS